MTHFTHDISAALEIAPLRAAFDRRKLQATAGLETWRHSTDRNFQAISRSLSRTDDFEPAADIVAHLSKDSTDVVILGIGGSSLGAQALAQVAFWGTRAYAPKLGLPRLHIIDNLDGATFAQLLAQLDLNSTRFHVVSKSGATTEPLLQLLTAISALEKGIGGKQLKLHFSGEAEPGNNPLRNILTDIGAPLLTHDPDLGGRYTPFSTVGLVPAMLAGLDPLQIRQAGRDSLDEAMKGHCVAVDGAALCVAASDIGLSQHVMFSYSDRLERLSKWWRQLWAESLGKAGHGTTPVDALGPVDQHSQLQLYLDGPADKLFTLIDVPQSAPAVASATWAAKHGLAAYAGLDMSAVVAAQALATAQTLRSHQRPVRRLSLSRPLDESSMGGLMMHFILETLISARLWNVDPFGQPAVEEGKILTRRYLEASK
jgi:glucose-6-phosphate isomerase